MERRLVTKSTSPREGNSGGEDKQLTLAEERKNGGDLARLLSLVSGVLFAFFCLSSWAGSAFAIENNACLECHGNRDILQMSEEQRLEMVVPTPGKEAVRKGGIALYVDYERFRSTVHRELQCTDCHSGIKSLPHPQRLGMVNCAQCHEGIVAQYAKSKHATVSHRLCFECHNPHATTSFGALSQKERMDICLRCHKEAGHTWLPQQKLHFQYLECTVCHSPKAEKGLFFYLSALGKDGKRFNLSYHQLENFTRGYNGDIQKAIDLNRDGIIQVYEINRFIAKLKEQAIQSPRLEEKILVLQPYHNFTDEIKEVKDCTMCHASDAPFYSHVMLRLPERRGGWRAIKMDKAVIGKIPPIPSRDNYFNTVHGKNGVECIDCHADLTVLHEGTGFEVKELGTPVCANCHPRVMAEYKNSLHARVSEKICFSCHDPHSSVPFMQLNVEQRQAICTKCHDPERGHFWLPQRELHFKYLECTMCHAPQAEKGMVFYLQRINKEGKAERLDYAEVAKLLGMERPDLGKLLDSDGNGFLEDREVLAFLQLLKERSPRETIELGVRVLVLKPSHNFTDKGTKAKDCAICHSSGAKFYSKLIMEIPESGGGVRTLPMGRSILAGIHAIPVTSGFYLLGEDRLAKRDVADLLFIVRKIGYKWLDVIGVLFILGSVGFVSLHAFLRIVTIKMRKRRHH
jgi:predicted CXXCH cytochrome family protein